MYLQVNGAKTYAYTGDHAFDAARPTLVFIHGVLNDHSVWILQSRHFAYNGWNVLAIDLPGHGRSAGQPPRTVEEGADFIGALLQAAGAPQAALVGHSWGSLIALEAAARRPEQVTRLALLGTAAPMRVAPALLEASVKEPEKAIHMVNVFSHSTLCPPPSALGPGTWLYGADRALMRRVLASNRETNLFYTGFKACDRYAGADAALAKVRCPVLFVIGRGDRMTPPKSARALAQHADHPRIVEVNGGHAMMVEAPDEVLLALQKFLGRMRG